MNVTSRREGAAAPLLSRYRPLVKLGAGGMADVFLAVSRTAGGLEKLAVIKRLRPEVAEDNEELEHFKGMFWDEAKLAMLLNHANVVHTYDASDAEDSLYIVMEYIEGQSLSALQRELERRGERLAPHHAAWIMAEVLAGLHYAHELHDLTGKPLDIVHRDVSPQNILLGYDGTVKLVDFGVAKASSRSTETRAGMFKGKARYMAPEQILNGTVDRRVDIYAAGAVLWEILARRPLVGGGSTVEQLVNVVKTEPERLSSVVRDVDPELDGIVHRAIARDLAVRYATAFEMREALLAYVSHAGGVRLPDLAAQLARVFAKRREETSRIVRERLALEAARDAQQVDSGPIITLETDRGDGSLPSIQSGARAVSGAVSISGAPASLAAGPVSGTTPSLIAPEAPSNGSRRTIGWLVGILMVLVLVVGILAGILVGGKKREETAAAPAPPRVETAVAPVVVPPAPPPATAAAAAPAPAPPAVESAKPVEAPKPVVQAPAAPPPRVWAPAPIARPKAPTPEAPTPPAAPAPEAVAQGGFLTLDTYPWTKVSENGRVLGTTPLVGVPLPAGTHVLTLDNPQDNVHQTTTVVVKPGETLSKRLAF